MTGLTRRRLMQSALGAASASAVGTFNQAQAQGAFDWQKFKGTKLEVLLQRGPYQDVLQKFEPEFTALTGIQIGSEQIPEQQYRQKLAIEFASGKPSFDACYVAQATQKRLFGKGKWLSDLKPLIADTSMTPADFDFADFTKASIQACTQPDGRVDTLPLTFHYNMLMYNKELLDKKGVRPPTTFEELAEAAQKLNDQANGISGFVARGLKNANTPVWTSFMLGHGIDPVTSDGKLQTDGPEAVAAAQLYQKLVRDCGPPGVAGFNWYECQAMFMQGRAAMWIDTSTVGATAADPTKSKIADKVGFIAMPKGPKVHRAPVFPSGMAVAAASAKQGPAWYYVQWATGKANQARQLAGGYGAGGRQSANEAAKSSSEAKLSREWLDVVIQSGDLAYPVLPDIVAANEFRDVFGVALTNLLSPGADAAKELKTATETFKPILERTEKT
jgi:multiple sugar transport system substrate-binding protein